MSIQEFAAFTHRAPVIIHSLDRGLYQVTVATGGEERLLVASDGRPLRSHNLQQLREVLARLPVQSLVLRQQSAYDEMIGQPPRDGGNTLEVELALAPDVPPDLH